MSSPKSASNEHILSFSIIVVMKRIMKKRIVFLILILISTTSLAQTLRCTAAYIYEKAQALDGEGSAIETFNNIRGTVQFYEKGGRTAIASTIGDQNMYVLEVISKKNLSRQ